MPNIRKSKKIEEISEALPDTTGIGSEIEEAAKKIYEEFTESLKETEESTKDFIEEIKNEAKESLESVPLLGDKGTELKEEPGEIAKEDYALPEAEVKAEEPKEVTNNLQEIIAGVTSDNTEIITGLKEPPEAGIEESLEKKEVKLEGEEKPVTSEASDTAAFAKVESASEQLPDDVEGKIEKVILENISLAGLISDLVLPTPQENKEVITGVTTDNKEIIAGLAEGKEAIPLENPEFDQVEPEIKAEQASQLESVVPVEEAPKGTDAVAEEFKNVTQWLVFTKDESTALSTEPAPEAPTETVTTSMEPGEMVADEFKDAKQWLVFTKEEKEQAAELEPVGVVETPTAKLDPVAMIEEHEPTFEDEFKHVKQWLVFSREEAPSAVLEEVIPEKTVPASDISEPELPPPLESQSRDELLESVPDMLPYNELETIKDSPTSHKQMFGSSIPEDENHGGKEVAEIPFETTSDTKHVETYEETIDTSKKPEEKKNRWWRLVGFL